MTKTIISVALIGMIIIAAEARFPLARLLIFWRSLVRGSASAGT